MSDQTIREIQVKWVGDASALISDIDTSRSEIEQFKTILRSLGADSEESLAVVEASFKRAFGAETLDPIRARIAQLKAELREWGDQPIEVQNLARDQGFLSGTEDDLAKEQEYLKRLTDDVRISVSELRKEFIQNAEAAQKSFASAGEATDKFRARVDEAKVEIQKLLAEGKQLSDIKVGLAETGRYEPTQLAQANREVEASIKAQSKAYDNLEKSINEASAAAKAAAQKTVAANKSAIASTDEWRAKVNAAKKELMSVTATGRSLGDAFRGVGDTGRHEGAALSQAMQEVGKETGEVKKGFSQLGNVANRVFRSIIGFMVLGVLRRLITTMSELVDQGNTLVKSIVDISLAVRKLQRAGEDISIQDVTDQISKLGEEFTNFSTKELNDGMAALIIMGERLNLTTDQMFEFAHAMAVAATVAGVDFSQGMERGLRAVSTGQTRGLNELLLVISELEVKEEAYRLKLVERGETVGKVAKQQALYSLIIQQSAELETDISLRQKTLTGQYEEQVAAIDNVESRIGKKLIPTKIKYLEILGRVLEEVEKLIDIYKSDWRNTIAELNASLAVSSEFFTSWWKAILGEGAGMSLSEAGDMFERIRDELIAVSEAADAGFTIGDDDIGTKLADSADVVDEASDEIVEAYDNLFIKLRESIIDGNQALEKENTNFFRKLLEDALKYALKIKQLADKLTFDRAKIERDFQDKVSDINTEARKKEVEAEEKYQRKLRELRRKFLLDLEDALQERDAKQILRLIRDYNSRKDELGRQRKGEKKDEEQDKLDKLEDLRKQRDRRLRELDIEYAFRRAKMREEWELENKLDWERHNQKLRDLEKQTDERNDEILRRFSDEWKITDEWATLIGNRLNQEFGPDGRVSQIYDYMIGYATQAAQAIAQAHMQSYRYMGGGFTDTGGTQESTNNLKIESYVPPKFHITPYIPPTFHTPPTFSSPNSNKSSTQIEVILSPDLEARVINQTKSDIAEVFIRAS